MAKIKTTFTYSEEMLDLVKQVAFLKRKNQNEIIEDAFMYWLENQDEKFVDSLKSLMKVSKALNWEDYVIIKE